MQTYRNIQFKPPSIPFIPKPQPTMISFYGQLILYTKMWNILSSELKRSDEKFPFLQADMLYC